MHQNFTVRPVDKATYLQAKGEGSRKILPAEETSRSRSRSLALSLSLSLS